MIISIAVCLASLVWLLWLSRRGRWSLGLPFAYLFSLLLIHVPGAIAHLVASDLLRNSSWTEIGVRFAAIGAVCFTVGVYWSRRSASGAAILRERDQHEFWWFCLLGGWLVTAGLSILQRIPSVGAAINKGSAIWMLGVMLGLRAALQQGDVRRAGFWASALLVYPILMLLLGGFLSYGATAIIVVVSCLTVSTRSPWRVAVGLIAVSYISLSVFVTYFQHRTDIRDQVWGGAPLEDRIDSVLVAARDFQWLDFSDDRQLTAIDQRLNQNRFIGIAYDRIQQRQVDYLYGRSVWEGLIALVPRALWPEKPVFGGSPAVVAEMTGLRLSPTTSWGIGNVMEFQINFGIPGVILGFLLLGWLIGILDLRAAKAESEGDLASAILFFVPAVALIQPNGSLVELFGGSAAAWGAAYGWRAAWNQWSAASRRAPLNASGRAAPRMTSAPPRPHQTSGRLRR